MVNKVKHLTLKSEYIDLRAAIGFNTTILNGTTIDSMSHIGNYCYIGKFCYVTKASIGNYCSIANNVSIGQGEHDLTQISTNSIFYQNAYDKLTEKECVIGNDVWIGVDAIIQRGVVIGNGAVIGSNAVVTKNIPPYAIVVGSPARIIRYRFSDEKISSIENSKWWLYSPYEAKKIFETLE